MGPPQINHPHHLLHLLHHRVFTCGRRGTRNLQRLWRRAALRSFLGRMGRRCWAEQRASRLVPGDGLHRLLHQLLHQLGVPVALLPPLQQVAEPEHHEADDADQDADEDEEQEHVLGQHGGGDGAAGPFHLRGRAFRRRLLRGRSLGAPRGQTESNKTTKKTHRSRCSRVAEHVGKK